MIKIIKKIVVFRWLFILTFVFVVVSIAYPWSLSSPQLYTSFDENLIFSDADTISNTNNQIVIDPQCIQIKTHRNTKPYLHILTTDNSFTTEFDVVISEIYLSSSNISEYSYPLKISLWNPSQGNELFLVFEEPNREIKIVTKSHGDVTSSNYIAPFVLNERYHIKAEWEKQKLLKIMIFDERNQLSQYAIDTNSNHEILTENVLTLSIYSSISSPNEYSGITISDYKLFITPRTRFAMYISDWRVILLSIFILIWTMMYLILKLALHEKIYVQYLKVVYCIKTKKRESTLVGLTSIIVFILYIFLSTSEGQPFDQYSMECWSYICGEYGLNSLYARSGTIPGAMLFGGYPGDSPAYVYPPLLSYLYYFIGKVYLFFIPSFKLMGGSGIFIFTKGIFSLFTIANGIILYLIARKYTSKWYYAYCIMLLYVLNPSIILNGMVWGQSDSILIFFFLLSVIGLVFEKPKILWIFLGLSLVTKQTAIIVLPIMMVLAIKKFGLRNTIQDASFAVIIIFCTITPMIFSGYHPSIIFTPTIGKFIDFATPYSEHGMPVTWDSYNFWTLVTGFQDLHQWDRMQISDLQLLPYVNISYYLAAKLIFGFLYCLIAILVIRLKDNKKIPSIPFVVFSCIFLVFVVFSTRILGRYYTLAIPFILLSNMNLRSVIMWSVLILATVIPFISMYGSLMQYSLDLGWLAIILDPNHIPLTSKIPQIYMNDTIINIYSTLSIIMFGLFLFVTIKKLRNEKNGDTSQYLQ